MPRVASLPVGWRHRSRAEKLEYLLKMPLDRIAEILCWSPHELDRQQLHVLGQVWHLTFQVLVKPLLDGRLEHEITRERNRAAALAELARRGSAAPDSRNGAGPR
jgi:hypothetical protein